MAQHPLLKNDYSPENTEKPFTYTKEHPLLINDHSQKNTENHPLTP